MRRGFQMHGGGIYYPLDELLKISEINISNGLKVMTAYLGALHPLRAATQLLEMFWGVSLSHNFCSKLTCEIGAKAEAVEKRVLEPSKASKDKQYLAYQSDGGRARIREDICLGKFKKQLFRVLDLCLTGSIEAIKIPENLQKQYSQELNPYIETKTTLVTNGEDTVRNTNVSENWEKTMDDFALEIKSKGYDTTPCNQALVSDGAQPIQDGFAKAFPDTNQILDHYHYSEHLNAAAQATFTNAFERKQWVQECIALCFNNKSEELLNEIELTKKLNTSEDAQKALRLLYNYTERNKERIKYGYFQDLGLPIGSGAIEASVKNMNDPKKIKSASIRWRKSNLRLVVSLRTVIFNDQFDELRKAA